MITLYVLLVVLLILFVALAVILSILITSRPRHANPHRPSRPTDSTRPTKSTNPAHNITSPKGYFFVYPEAKGYTLDELTGVNSLPSETVIKKNFKTVVSIGNSASKVIVNKATGKDRLEESFEFVEKQYPNMKVIRWMAYAFNTDSLFCMCNSKSDPDSCAKSIKTICSIIKDVDCSAASSCAEGAKRIIQSDISKYDLKGIMFDDEYPGSGSKIIPIFEKLKQTSGGTLMIGWAGDIRRADKGPTDKEKYGTKSTTWDFCLGQAYTANTLDLYNGGCSAFDDSIFWKNLADREISSKHTIAVPMVCGAGDCQGDTNIGSVGFKCVDERLSGIQIEKLIDAKPDAMHDFAVWYGTHPVFKGGIAKSGCEPHTNDCCYVSEDNMKECSTGCCAEWQLS